MKTKLIGYKISVGEMDDKSNPGNKIPYNSRTITFITDMGESDTYKGFSPFDAKFKLDELAKILHVNPTNEDVNHALNMCLTKDVICNFAPVFGELKCVGFMLAK